MSVKVPHPRSLSEARLFVGTQLERRFATRQYRGWYKAVITEMNIGTELGMDGKLGAEYWCQLKYEPDAENEEGDIEDQSFDFVFNNPSRCRNHQVPAEALAWVKQREAEAASAAFDPDAAAPEAAQAAATLAASLAPATGDGQPRPAPVLSSAPAGQQQKEGKKKRRQAGGSSKAQGAGAAATAAGAGQQLPVGAAARQQGGGAGGIAAVRPNIAESVKRRRHEAPLAAVPAAPPAAAPAGAAGAPSPTPAGAAGAASTVPAPSLHGLGSPQATTTAHSLQPTQRVQGGSPPAQQAQQAQQAQRGQQSQQRVLGFDAAAGALLGQPPTQTSAMSDMLGGAFMDLPNATQDQMPAVFEALGLLPGLGGLAEEEVLKFKLLLLRESEAQRQLIWQELRRLVLRGIAAPAAVWVRGCVAELGPGRAAGAGAGQDVAGASPVVVATSGADQQASRGVPHAVR